VKKILFAIAAICINAFGPHIANAQTEPEVAPSKVWIGSTQSEKILYARGFVDGATVAKERVRQLVQMGRARWFKTSATADFDSSAARYLKQFITPPGADFGSIIDVMNKVYSDPANSCLPWMVVFIAATDILLGRSAAVEEHLSRVRGTVANKCTFP